MTDIIILINYFDKNHIYSN